MVDQKQIIDLLKTNFPFRKLEEESVELVARQLAIRHYSSGKIIYRQGNPGDELFIVLSGLIRLSISDGNRRKTVSILRSGDILGLEIFEGQLERITNATAIRNTVLLSLDREKFRYLCDNIPNLEISLKILLESLQLRLHKQFDWLDQDEAVYYLARRHFLHIVYRFIPAFIILAILISLLTNNIETMIGRTLPLILIGSGLTLVTAGVLWTLVDWINDYSIITNRRVIFLEKIILIYDSRIESPINQIVSVSIETGQLGRWLSYGDVIIRTYTGSMVLPMVHHPAIVASLLESDWYRVQSRQTKMEKNEMEIVIKKRLGLVNKGVSEETMDEMAVVEDYPGSLGDLLSHFFNLRYEKGDMVVYRKHWFILLKRIFIPTFMLIFLQILFLATLLEIISILSIIAMLGITVAGNLILVLWWTYEYLDWGNDMYIIARDRIIDIYKKPLGHEERREAPIRNILSIDFERLGILGLMFNFGTVSIRVGDSTLTFDYVYNPSDIQRELFNRLSEITYGEKQEMREFEEQRMADWIETYHQVIEKEGKDPEE